ncbi:MAG TPA: Gfo/Idh/MocA family oxidoreductase, partial [Chitinophagaceae bacterium]|nr:Gfo/Idh/MocA family oxidoreductase [Chitinophagaceae bacterium]
PQFMKEVRDMGVEIVASIDELLSKTDAILLNTNDGRLHLEQALPVLKAGKRMFIDKPLAASLPDVLAIFAAAEKYHCPVFSSSSLRYIENASGIGMDQIGKIMGADTYSPATIEKTHPDLFWYGIHGVELLYTAMGTGCSTVVRISENETDVVVGTWRDGRLGTFRGTRTGPHEYGGIVFGEKGIVRLQPPNGYGSLLQKITGFFDTGIPPVSPAETIEIYTFMEAAGESKRQNGLAVGLTATLDKAKALHSH